MIPKLVMMIPLRRCGSNAIRLRMNLHKDFYSPYPLHLVDIMSILPQYGNLENDSNYFRLITDMIGLQSMSLIKWPNIVFDPESMFNKLRHQPRSVYRIYGEMLLCLGEKQHVSIVMDKCQDSVCHFEEIISFFPDMLFLDVIRDPRAQICSMNKAIIYDFDTMLNTIRWVESRKWADRVREKYPSQFLTIRYEDFVEQHEYTMKQICSFLGIPFDPVILDISESQEALSMSIMSPLWETNYSLPNPIHINKFKKFLSMSEIESIETMTLNWMEQYGYIPITSHQKQFGYDLDLAIQNSNLVKTVVWENLKQYHPHDYILRKSRLRYIFSLYNEERKNNI